MKFKELCLKHGALKTGMGYTDLYEEYFRDKRSKINKFLEIGLTHGGSMKMWNDYFPKAKIHGMEYAMGNGEEYQANLKKLPSPIFDNIYNGDQSKRSDLKQVIDKFKGDFDIIVDDGGHMMHEQCISLGYLFSHVKSGGYYVIEDLHTSLVSFPNRWNIGIGSSREFSYKYKIDQNNFPKDGKPTFTTLEVLENYQKNKKIESPYMKDSEASYLTDNIDEVKIYFTTCNIKWNRGTKGWGNKYVIAFIKKNN